MEIFITILLFRRIWPSFRGRRSMNVYSGIKNDRGSTLLLVVVLSSALLVFSVTLASIIVERAKHTARVREAYKLMNAMEEAAKTVQASYGLQVSKRATAASVTDYASQAPLI